jgi:Domain of unknown function (DUF4129)
VPSTQHSASTPRSHAVCLLLLGALAVSMGQAIDAYRVRADAGDVAVRIHAEGRYPDDISPFDDRDHEQDSDATPVSRTVRTDHGTPPPPEEAPAESTWLDWLARALARLFGSLSGGATFIGWALLVLAVLAIVALIAVALRAFVWKRAHSTQIGIQPETSGTAVDPLLVGSGVPHERLAADGLFREAIHAVFLIALEHVAGSLSAKRSRTARELVEGAPCSEGPRDILSTLLALTELVWFGGRDASREQYESAVRMARSLEALS